MVTPDMNHTGQNTAPIVSGRAASITSSAGSRVYSGVSFDPEGLSARVLQALRLSLTALRIAPVSCSLPCAPGKQKYLPNTSPDHKARLFLGDVRVLKRDG